jgi:hypothetical protein
VTLGDYTVTRTSMRVVIAPQADRRYRTEFIGRGGRVLATSYTTTSEYRFTGSEGYVRARIVDSSDRRAWMQPVMLPRR